MVEVGFFLAGYNKCGTTTLAAMLRAHPDVLLPSIEEPWFLSRPDFEQHWPAYESLFPDWQRYRAVGDDSTAYSSVVGRRRSLDAIARHYPDARFVFILRDPVDRIESAFREFHDTGIRFGLTIPLDFTEAVLDVPQILADSRYLDGIGDYVERFGADRVLVVYLEDLAAEPTTVLGRVFTHIGVDPQAGPTSTAPRLNPGTSKYRDSRLLRGMRRNHFIGPRLAKVPIPRQEAVFRRIGLRRRSTAPPVWRQPAVDAVVDRVWPSVEELWRAYPRPRTGWPRLEGLVSTGRVEMSR